MGTISHKKYLEANLRLEELLEEVDNTTPEGSPLSKEPIEVSDIIEQYKELHFPMGLSALQEMIELRMFEKGLKRKDLAVLLNTSAPNISDYLNEKFEITLKVAKALHQKLNIDSDIILQYRLYEKQNATKRKQRFSPFFHLKHPYSTVYGHCKYCFGK